MKTYYTKEEVLEIIPLGNQEQFQQFGFNCISYFCETSKGWVASFEDCCPFCVHAIIKAHGTKDDKVKFNSLHDLGDNYIIPLTRKDIALGNKRHRKTKQRKWWKKNGVQRKDLEKILGMFRKHNINVQRVGKKNLYTHLDGVSFYKNRDIPAQYVYLPEITLPNNIWFLCVRTEQDILDHVKSLVVKYNENHNASHKVPMLYKDLIILEEKA